MRNRIAAAVFATMISFSATAEDTSKVVKSYELKNGSYVHVMDNGKIVMKDPYGHDMHMKEGMAMEMKDGGKIIMKENQIFRLDDNRREQRRGN
ncbi:copper resistance protein K [Cupriavidus metallidurans]|uniref:CopK family periplasmic copper-binding protein n=1 Tax=Cupriavidus TaxID=106589 RepID=UPI0004930BFB|nr:MULTISPECIES: CopK family periplasmic copper-binding protein [Cupriavidus]MDE4920234.1 CopK family periplasmic copper-binding protein [Cupriavidus metallidurans]GMG94573.1 hypothetical protein Cmtc_57930 [Cupriavidus sp. TKC]